MKRKIIIKIFIANFSYQKMIFKIYYFISKNNNLHSREGDTYQIF